MAWDLKQLREYIEERNGHDSMQMAFLASIDRYILIQLYHRDQAYDAMKGIVHEGDGAALNNSRYVLGVAENQNDYKLAKVANEANLIACIHATSAMYDIFSQLVNSLVLDEQVKFKKCTFDKVFRALPESKLKAELRGVKSLHWYRWLMDFVNTIKHRQLMRHRFTVNLEEPGSGIYIDGFEYKNRVHPKRTDKEILKGTIQVAKAIVPCGCALNATVLPT